jgi:hypothetical protein
MLSYDYARKIEPQVDAWMTLAQNTALTAHTLLSENDPDLPKVPADIGG